LFASFKFIASLASRLLPVEKESMVDLAAPKLPFFTGVQILTPGVYIAMNGRIFDSDRVRKNPDKNRFEIVEE